MDRAARLLDYNEISAAITKSEADCLLSRGNAMLPSGVAGDMDVEMPLVAGKKYLVFHGGLVNRKAADRAYRPVTCTAENLVSPSGWKSAFFKRRLDESIKVGRSRH
jgi:hypothetical protein